MHAKCLGRNDFSWEKKTHIYLCFVFSNFSVEMFFRNESGKEPFPLTVPGCQHKCPLQRFLELTDAVVPQDWEQECHVASSIHDTGEPRLDQCGRRRKPG